jgi:hypothetical protein
MSSLALYCAELAMGTEWKPGSYWNNQPSYTRYSPGFKVHFVALGESRNEMHVRTIAETTKTPSLPHIPGRSSLS